VEHRGLPRLSVADLFGIDGITGSGLPALAMNPLVNRYKGPRTNRWIQMVFLQARTSFWAGFCDRHRPCLRAGHRRAVFVPFVESWSPKRGAEGGPRLVAAKFAEHDLEQLGGRAPWPMNPACWASAWPTPAARPLNDPQRQNPNGYLITNCRRSGHRVRKWCGLRPRAVR